ncbi:MAG: Fis family transcriptional regulator [Burkholderiaceae bacterium]|jgi:Fis family transcriptional regulator|nr:Fis family transcriptional regulator [Burkholderiaceae bacterium]
MGTTPIEDCIRASLEAYFTDLGAAEPTGVYAMVVRAAERPLLQVVMARAGGNQSRAAQWLGLNRNTLRKKLQEHQLITPTD